MPDGSTVVYEGTLIRKVFGASEVLRLAINLAEGVGTGVVGSWLYAKLKSKPAKLRIDRKRSRDHADRLRIVIEEFDKEE